MGRLYLVADIPEIGRRRGQIGSSALVEVWRDLELSPSGDDLARSLTGAPLGNAPPGGLVWVSEDSKRLLDSIGEPLAFRLALDEDAVPIYYGPHVGNTDSLPTEGSLRARVLSAHGIAVLWATRDSEGRRNEFQPTSPGDPTFYLRRPRGTVVHVWRLFRTRAEAIGYATAHLVADAEADRWARELPARDYQDLLARWGQRG